MRNLSEEKLYKPFSNNIEIPNIYLFLRKILAKDVSFLWISIIYGIAISILGLGVPISVQFLINSVSFTAMVKPIAVLGVVLFILLSFLAILTALQFYVTEIFQRRFFARMGSEIGLHLLNSDHSSVEKANQTEMVNRFLDTTTVQKAVPTFLTKTFSLILQTITGLILVAFYHPILFVFSIFIILSLFLIWVLFYKKAIIASCYESRRKFDLVGWLEDITRGHIAFKSSSGYEYAKSKIDFLISQYFKERRVHFRSLFSQVILLLILYVVGSTLLLVVGGWLVLKGQLTLGQLVASEIILSAALYGISQLGRDFESFYDLVAACEKLSQFQNIPNDRKHLDLTLEDKNLNYNLENVVFKYSNRDYHFNLEFQAGKNYVILTEGFSTQRVLIDLIYGFRFALYGSVKVNKIDIQTLNLYDLRDKIAIVDNSPFPECKIKEYLDFGNPDINDNDIMMALETVGLNKTIARTGGLDLNIIPSGWPFSESEKLLLKFAKILIQKPSIIIITEVLDMMMLQARQNIIRFITKNHDATIIYFSHRTDGIIDFDEYLFVEKDKNFKFNEIEELNKFIQEKNSLI